MKNFDYWTEEFKFVYEFQNILNNTDYFYYNYMEINFLDIRNKLEDNILFNITDEILFYSENKN